ncbi:hypothetical protein SUGI_1523690 [Cryptomeria japonica]|uniref:Uncharacterized protein n=1 Tax=Cryptomeria japonica TaxID=3369 RepID=A0AAD3NW25_CRYJA|nr:hypothetical protein SUGI_1518510 [Cryptomeria japonica]GLJ59801.1 hypothetical protein SUGI_1523690 [Cryptomeria japonica]
MESYSEGNPALRCTGVRRQATGSKLLEKEVCKQEEIKRRIELSEASITYNNALDNCSASFKCPSTEKTREGTATVLANGKNVSCNILNRDFDCN